MSDQGAADIDELCFRARALAQTHPMTQPAHRYRQARFEQERGRQPVSEIADWAGTAMLVGYCLRRAEEQVVDGTSIDPEEHSVDDYETAAATLAEALRCGDASSVTLLSAEATIAALDRIIAAELDKRHEHVREQLDDAAWAELEDYIAWWVTHGYAVRAAERPCP